MSWQQLKLAEFCKTGSGSTPSRAKATEYYGGTIPWVKSGELKEQIIVDTVETVTEKALAETAIKMVPKGALLMAMYGATVGRMAFLGKAATTNQAVCHIITDPTICEDRYLFYHLQNMIPQILDKRVGGGQPNISQQIIKSLEIPLPPLAEQTRIAAILDKADSIHHKRQKAIKLVDEFLRATFLDMFGDPVINPKGWPLGTIRELISEAKYGTAKKASGSTGEYPILRMNNITQGGKMDFTDLKYIDLEKKEEDKYLAKKGDLLFNRTNSKELVGKTAVFESNLPMAIAGYLIRVRANEKSTPHYISAYLNSKHGKTTLFRMCKNIIGMANINAQELQDIKILIPPAELQNKYTKIVEFVNRKKETLTTSLDESNFLFRALSQRAFKGEL